MVFWEYAKVFFVVLDLSSNWNCFLGVLNGAGPNQFGALGKNSGGGPWEIF